MNIFFTGCTHFDHTNIIKLANRPFQSTDEMNETMIDNWNRVVTPKDIVYHLGDFGFINNRNRVDELLKRLNGNKILIKGNHDDAAIYQSPFWYVTVPYLEVKREKQKFILFHYPIEEWNDMFKGSIHLHAHTHHPSKTGRMYIPNRFNVTVEARYYTPVSIDEFARRDNDD